jgi:hypothetical protein
MDGYVGVGSPMFSQLDRDLAGVGELMGEVGKFESNPAVGSPDLGLEDSDGKSAKDLKNEVRFRLAITDRLPMSCLVRVQILADGAGWMTHDSDGKNQRSQCYRKPGVWVGRFGGAVQV